MDDWRLTNQIKYLNKKKLIKHNFEESEINDHEHCEFCFKKIQQDEKSMDAVFCTEDRYHWICEECYNDFKEIFDWIVIEIERK